MMMYFPVALTVVSSLGYHLLLKEASGRSSPLFLLFWSYLAAALVCLSILVVTKHELRIDSVFQEKIHLPALLAMAIVGIEIGYILAYKNGGSVSQISMFTQMLSLIVICLVGHFLLKESFNLKKLLGLASALMSLILLARS